MFIYCSVLLSLLTISNIDAQIPFPGSCPSIPVVTDFIPSRYLGKWYEAERYFAVFQFGGRCVSATYSSRADGTIKVYNQQISGFSGSKSTIEGTAKLVGSPEIAKLVVRFPNLPVDIPAPYWVVDTDYDNYAVVWGCNDFGVFHTRNVWILTRERKPSMEVLKQAYNVLQRVGISQQYLLKTIQNNCPKDS